MGNSYRIFLGRSLAFGAIIALAACEDGQLPIMERLGLNKQAEAGAAPAQKKGKTVERDVEAPDVFSANEPGLWDGRPSLGGVWVAHPDVKDPERVIIRNLSNNKFVVGALFRRERDIPGPRLQISSDAAAALSMLAGAPADLSVVALRREEVAVEPETPVAAEPLDETPEVSEAPLDPIATASAAIEAAPETEAETAATGPRIETAAASAQPAAAQPSAPAPKPAAKSASRLEKPFIQIGIFSVKGNADRTAAQMRAAGVIPSIKEGNTAGKPFWRVVAGPATTSSERKSLLAKIKDVGFTDAYPVTN